MPESLPPLSLEQLREELKNPNFSTYVVVGTKASKRWKLAVAAQQMIPGVRCFRADSSVAADLRKAFKCPPSHVALVFAFGDKLKNSLTSSRAENFLNVTTAIREARA